jgi:hypothetical protein
MIPSPALGCNEITITSSSIWTFGYLLVGLATRCHSLQDTHSLLWFSVAIGQVARDSSARVRSLGHGASLWMAGERRASLPRRRVPRAVHRRRSLIPFEPGRLGAAWRDYVGREGVYSAKNCSFAIDTRSTSCTKYLNQTRKKYLFLIG